MEQRCETCAWWVYPKGNWAPCEAPLPASALEDKKLTMRKDDGEHCQCWKERDE